MLNRKLLRNADKIIADTPVAKRNKIYKCAIPAITTTEHNGNVDRAIANSFILGYHQGKHDKE